MASASAGADPLALLPSSDDAFRRKQYWDSFFAKRGSRAFEWYGSWGDVKGPLSTLADKDGAIVVVGCGNSDLSSDMYDAGLRNITSLDYSEGVVAEMAAKNASREGMKWLVADARATGLPSDSVLLVVDKGTLDAMLPEASAEAASDAASLLAEGMRLVRPGGSYACVSLLQDQVLACLAASVGHDDSGFRVDVAPFEPAERSPLCPFLVVITKPDPSSAAADPRDVAAGVVEGMSGSLGGVWRFHDDASHIGAADSPFDPETIPDTASLRRLVSAAAFRHRSREALRSTVPGQALSMALFDGRGAAAGTPGSAEPTPRFTLFAVDASARRTCSALVIPSGREAEWVFGTDEGRASLAADAGAGRLLLVRRNKGHTFPADEAAVREELAGSVASAAPEGLEGPIAWLGVATDGDIVETVAEVTVELDPVVASVARDHFGFAPDDRCRLTVADGVEHILARADAAPSRPDLSLDALVIDVDAKDLSSGLSFPPKVFLDPPFLRAARACLRPGGCVVFNIACRVPTVLEAVLADVAAAFDWAMQTQITDGTLNRLVVAGTNPATDDAGTPLLRLPSGRRAISDAVEAWLSPTTPSGAAACTVRGSAPCSFAGLDLDAFNGWVRDLKWLKRPDEAFLDEEDATAAPADTAVASKAGGGGRKRAGKGRKKRR